MRAKFDKYQPRRCKVCQRVPNEGEDILLCEFDGAPSVCLCEGCVNEIVRAAKYRDQLKAE